MPLIEGSLEEVRASWLDVRGGRDGFTGTEASAVVGFGPITV